jgi:hypothetical protein
MTVLEKGAPAAAIVAALSTLACCVPLGFLGAVGLASLSVAGSHFSVGRSTPVLYTSPNFG